METLLFLMFCVVDAIIIIGVVFLGWRPFHKVLERIWGRVWRFLLVLGLTSVGLTLAVPWIDQALYMQGYRLDDDFMIFFAPAFIIIVSLAAAITVVWELERRGNND